MESDEETSPGGKIGHTTETTTKKTTDAVDDKSSKSRSGSGRRRRSILKPGTSARGDDTEDETGDKTDSSGNSNKTIPVQKRRVSFSANAEVREIETPSPNNNVNQTVREDREMDISVSGRSGILMELEDDDDDIYYLDDDDDTCTVSGGLKGSQIREAKYPSEEGYPDPDKTVYEDRAMDISLMELEVEDDDKDNIDDIETVSFGCTGSETRSSSCLNTTVRDEKEKEISKLSKSSNSSNLVLMTTLPDFSNRTVCEEKAMDLSFESIESEIMGPPTQGYVQKLKITQHGGGIRKTKTPTANEATGLKREREVESCNQTGHDEEDENEDQAMDISKSGMLSEPTTAKPHRNSFNNSVYVQSLFRNPAQPATQTKPFTALPGYGQFGSAKTPRRGLLHLPQKCPFDTNAKHQPPRPSKNEVPKAVLSSVEAQTSPFPTASSQSTGTSITPKILPKVERPSTSTPTATPTATTETKSSVNRNRRQTFLVDKTYTVGSPESGEETTTTATCSAHNNSMLAGILDMSIGSFLTTSTGSTGSENSVEPDCRPNVVFDFAKVDNITSSLEATLITEPSSTTDDTSITTTSLPSSEVSEGATADDEEEAKKYWEPYFSANPNSRHFIENWADMRRGKRCEYWDPVKQELLNIDRSEFEKFALRYSAYFPAWFMDNVRTNYEIREVFAIPLEEYDTHPLILKITQAPVSVADMEHDWMFK